MSRSLRLEYPGSLWHVTARGNARAPIFYDDLDRERYVEMLGEAVRRFRWILTSYQLMTNHVHHVIELTEESLSDGMQWLHGGYAQRFNLRHDRVGHLFQKRFHSVLVEKETYFQELQRYVALNPVRAGMVARPEDHKWSSYRAICGDVEAPSWLAVDDALLAFAPELHTARQYFREFVRAGIGSSKRIWDDVVGQIYLGSESWVERTRERVELKPREREYPKAQREIAKPTMSEIISAVAEVTRCGEERIRQGRGGIPRMVAAWLGCYTGRRKNIEIAASLRLHSDSRVTRLVQQCERELAQDRTLQTCVDQCIATLSRKKCESKV